ncbi:MAG: DUF1828 domain-containing protein [Trueperaceae bacterium]|nr:DUF1828 domain-containing protein [Trueperaceae bacterium]
MITEAACKALGDGLPPLFRCETHGKYVRVRTPYLYPDGDNIDLFLHEEGSITVVTDLGETSRWLRMQTTSPRRSPKQDALLRDACVTHGVEWYRGMVLARSRSAEDLPSVVLRVAQAALRIADLWFTFRTRSIVSVTDEVSDFLEEKDFHVDRAEKIIGRSGSVWKPDFHVRAPSRSSLVYVLSTGSRSAARQVVTHVYTAFSDLSHLHIGPEALQFVSLFDDDSDVWDDEAFRLAEQVSTVTRWSEPDRFEEVLRAA